MGSSMTRPPVFGMISILTPAHEQGATMGVAQGVGSLARIVGPIFVMGIFGKDHLPVPYLCCALLCFATGCITTRYLTLPKKEVVP
jgi:MFS family permease